MDVADKDTQPYVGVTVPDARYEWADSSTYPAVTMRVLRTIMTRSYTSEQRDDKPCTARWR